MIFNWFNKRMKQITDKINEQENSAAQARQRLEENNKVRPPC